MRESLEHALPSVFSEVCRGVRFPQTNDERQLLLEFANHRMVSTLYRTGKYTQKC
jgi:hypothetical protein